MDMLEQQESDVEAAIAFIRDIVVPKLNIKGANEQNLIDMIHRALSVTWSAGCFWAQQRKEINADK